MGRTGRTGPGTCYHLYTKDDFEFNMDRFPLNSKFANDIHFIHNKKLYEKCIKAGFNESSLVLTGSPLFDDLFTRIQKFKTLEKS